MVNKSQQKQIALWLEQGWHHRRMASAAAELWKMPANQFDKLLSEIRHEQQQSLDIERQEFLAQQMTRLEALAVRAQEEGNLAVALGCFKELHALAKLHGS